MKTADILVEGVYLMESKTYKLWESAGSKLVEANLTPDQIQQIFKNAETGATAAGGNRTMLGKGADAASAVNKAWEELKTKVQNSGPIKNVDAYYDQAAEKLKQATGGDAGVMKYVQMYRDFAKKHPVAQSLIYSALIAAAGISGAGLGGAAALGLFKMVDKLLQGEKFSSAAYSGAKTGAAAYAAGQIGKAMKGPQGDVSQGNFNGDEYKSHSYAPPKNPDGSLMTPQQIAAAKASLRAGNGAAESAIIAGTILSERQIASLFKKVEKTTLTEGPLDAIKGAAQSAANWAATKGANLTNKVTADKLMQAWKKAGSPTDSEEVSKIVQAAGVAPEVVTKALTDAGVTPEEKPEEKPADTAPEPEAKPEEKPETPASGNSAFADYKKLRAAWEDFLEKDGNVSGQVRGVLKDILSTALKTVESKAQLLKTTMDLTEGKVLTSKNLFAVNKLLKESKVTWAHLGLSYRKQGTSYLLEADAATVDKLWGEAIRQLFASGQLKSNPQNNIVNKASNFLGALAGQRPTDLSNTGSTFAPSENYAKVQKELGDITPEEIELIKQHRKETKAEPKEKPETAPAPRRLAPKSKVKP